MRTLSLAVVVLASLAGTGVAQLADESSDASALEQPITGSVVSLGSLDVSTEPGTTILWDNTPLGTTDDSGHMSISTIPPGTYTVTARKSGFDSAKSEVEILAGQQELPIPLSMPPAATPAEAAEASLPDPFARRSTPLVSAAVISLLVLVSVGALWLGRRRRLEPDEEMLLEPEGPRVVLANEPRGRRRAPGFYEDLRQRETVLEGLEDRGPGRPKPKIIDLPVVDHRPVEGED